MHPTSASNPPTRPAAHARRSGVALVTALGVLLIIGILVAGTLLTTQIELGITRNDATATQAQYAAEAGLQAAKATLFQNYRWIEEYYQTDDSVGRAACFSRIGAGLDLDRDGSIEIPWNGNRLLLFDDGTVTATSGETVGQYDVRLLRDSSGRDIYTIESEGRSSGARATVRSTVLLDNTGVLEQALFTGVGQANRHLNGGATIRGGVYVVGDEANPDNNVINARGNFEMQNWYDLSNGGYATDGTSGTGIDQRITSENRTSSNLCATLRAQYGQVELSGSVLLGTPSDFEGNENGLLGVFVGDEPSDLQNNVGDCPDNNSKGICADEIGTFDINEADAPKFPELDDEPNAEQCFEGTWRTCIDAEADANGLTLNLAALADGATESEFDAMFRAENGFDLNVPASCYNAFGYNTASAPAPWRTLLAGGARLGGAVAAVRLPGAASMLAATDALVADHKPKHSGGGRGNNGGGGGNNADTGNNNTAGNPGWTLTLDRDIDCTTTKLVNGSLVRTGFRYDASTTPGKLEVFGSVNLIGGNLLAPNDVEYYARTSQGATSSVQNASFVVQAGTDAATGGDVGGDVTLQGSLVTGNGSYNGRTYNRFPEHVLSLIAEDDIVAEGQYTMAPMYAGDAFRTVKDRVVIGSVVSNTFCTTSAGGDSKCNAGQKSEIVYVNTGNNKPELLRFVESAGTPVFTVLSYEVR